MRCQTCALPTRDECSESAGQSLEQSCAAAHSTIVQERQGWLVAQPIINLMLSSIHACDETQGGPTAKEHLASRRPGWSKGLLVQSHGLDVENKTLFCR